MNLRTTLGTLMAVCGLLFAMPHADAAKKEKKRHESSSCSSSSHCNECKLLKKIKNTTEQDLLVDRTTLNVANQINNTTTQDLAIDKRILEIVEQFDCVTVISELPYVIDTPGHYKVPCDLVFNPDFSDFSPSDPFPSNQQAVQAAITITASNVLLDLGGSHISQFVPANPSDQVPFCVGILVPDPLPNSTDINAVGQESVYIIGNEGVISDFSMYGVRMFAHLFDIQLKNVTIKNCGTLASKALRPISNGFSYLPHTTAITPGFGPSFGVGGLVIGESSVLGMGPTFFTDVVPAANNLNRLSSIVLDNVSCLNSFFNGIMLVNASDITINNCHFDKTFSDDPGSTTAPAYNVIPAHGARFANLENDIASQNGLQDPCILNMTVTNSTFNETTLNGDFSTLLVNANRGIPVTGCLTYLLKNIVWDSCQFNSTINTFIGNSGTAATTIAGNYNFSAQDFTFLNCNFDDVRSISSANGCRFESFVFAPYIPVLVPSKNIYFKNCTAFNIQYTGDPRALPNTGSTRSAVGFALLNVKDVTMDSCIAQDIINFGPSGGNSFNSGFGMQSTSAATDPLVENCHFINCVASRVQALNGGNATGFLAFAAANNSTKALVFENCIADGCISIQPTNGTFFGSGNGFMLEGSGNFIDTMFSNCKAVNNKGNSAVTTSGITLYSSGYYLYKTQRTFVENCQALDNVYGFMLNQSDKCDIRDNQADLNALASVGEGFTDLGVLAGGTPGTPGLSTSIFQGNAAFANGNGVTHVGQNGNYNIFVSLAPPTRPSLLSGANSTGIFTPTDPATYFAGLHNISTTP